MPTPNSANKLQCVLCLCAGEFQEVVDSKLRHTHPRVQKQRAAAANLAASVAASTAASMATSVEEDATDTAGTQLQPSSSGSSSSSQQEADLAAVAAAAASSSEKGLQVVQVLPWADAVAEGDKGEVLLELDGVSINTPDGGLALVQNLTLKVRGQSCFVTPATT
jgi:hypothetical protein